MACFKKGCFINSSLAPSVYYTLMNGVFKALGLDGL